MEPLPTDDPAALDDDRLQRLIVELERRRPPATVPSMGVRPDRRPWTYRDIWLLEAATEELAGRSSLDP